MTATVFILCALFSVISAQTLCTDENIEQVGRVVFGIAGDESLDGQLAVAYTIVNRVNNQVLNYPNTLLGVLSQTIGLDISQQYNMLTNTLTSALWSAARLLKTEQYLNAIDAAAGALCGALPDPTGCATALCAVDPCLPTIDTLNVIAYNKTQIGNLFFFCQKLN